MLQEIGSGALRIRETQRVPKTILIGFLHLAMTNPPKNAKAVYIRKGNPYVRRLLCEMANAARRTKSMIPSKYSGLVLRRGHKRAIIVLAHKILKTVFILLKEPLPRVPFFQHWEMWNSVNLRRGGLRPNIEHSFQG